MITYSLSASVFLYHADMREALRLLPDNSIDSVCCDPPYHLTSVVERFGSPEAALALSNGATGVYARSSAGFMGKQWDGGDIAFQVATWREVLRVLKPGGYVAAFGAPKNFGRLQVAILDAGFEERDTILHMVDPTDPICQFLESLSTEQMNAFMRCLADSELSGFLAWTFGTGFPKSQNVARFIDRELGVTGSFGDPKSAAHAGWIDRGRMRTEGAGEVTNGFQRPWQEDAAAVAQAARQYLPASPQGQEFDGFGTALKPAFEPIVLARKPLSEDTVAANVLRWRTGALNVDACRVPTDEKVVTSRNVALGSSSGGVYGSANVPGVYEMPADGRWPANVVHDGSAEVVGAFPSTDKPNGRPNCAGKDYELKNRQIYGQDSAQRYNGGYLDFGSAARFFYSAKASKADRAGSKHPTVKPIALMAYLARLLTPPGGVVLDPFAGSGTTGAACAAEGFRCVLVEREAEYVVDIRRRFGQVPSPPLVPELPAHVLALPPPY